MQSLYSWGDRGMTLWPPLPHSTPLRWSMQLVQSSFVVLQHCLVSVVIQTLKSHVAWLVTLSQGRKTLVSQSASGTIFIVRPAWLYLLCPTVWLKSSIVIVNTEATIMAKAVPTMQCFTCTFDNMSYFLVIWLDYNLLSSIPFGCRLNL